MKRLECGVPVGTRSPRNGLAWLVTLVEVLLTVFAVGTVVIAIQIFLNQTSVHSSGSETSIGEPVISLAMISNGRELWVRRGICEIIAIDLETEECRRPCGRIRHPVPRSQISQDGATCLLTIVDRELVVFRGRELLVSDPLPADSSTRIALSSNGRIAIRVLDGTLVRHWDLSNDEPVESDYRLSETADSIVLDSTGDKLLVSTDQGQLCVHDAKTGKSLQTFEGTGRLNGSPVFSDDGTCLAVARGQSVSLYDASSGKIAWTVQTQEPESCYSCGTLAISPDGRWVATLGVLTGIHILDRSNGELVRKFFKPQMQRGLAFSRSSDLLYSGCHNGSIDIWSLTEGRGVKRIKTSMVTSTGKD